VPDRVAIPCQVGVALSLAGVLLASACQNAERLTAPVSSRDAPACVTSADGGATAGTYRFYFRSAAELSQVARTYAIVEVRPEDGYALLELAAADVQSLTSQGSDLQYDGPEETSPDKPLPACLRDVDGLYAAMRARVAAHPSLAELIDYGDSWRKVSGRGGYDLLALRLGAGSAADQPRLFVAGGVHGRELIGPEVALRFVDQLLEGYGRDADATMILDETQIYVVVVVNPDGRQLAQQGCSQRKNRDDSAGACTLCSATVPFGVDLNRNGPFAWGGASASPCSQTYQGKKPASEPEVQSYTKLLSSIFPRPAAGQAVLPAPRDASGMVVSLHSRGDMVLWPWGHSFDAAPNGTALTTLGRKLAFFNGYRPQQSSEMYTTTGDIDDWAYAELGVPAITIEMGTEYAPSCATVEEIARKNLGALVYSAKAARAPYALPAGPDATAIGVATLASSSGSVLEITATIDDGRYGQGNGVEEEQAVAAAELSIDLAPWADGSLTIPMAALDGAFDASSEVVFARVETRTLGPGRHTIYVHGRDAAGNWGVVSAAFASVDGE
jgi:carboxypeptidase T